MINKTKQLINEFTIGYIINPSLNVKKYFGEQVEKCMYTTFDEITKTFINATLEKKNTIVLAFIMFYETRANYSKKSYRVLRCVILYHNQKLCLYWLSSVSIKKISEIHVGSGGVSKHGEKYLIEY